MRVVWFVFEGEAVVARGVEQASACFVNAREIEVREGVRLVTRREERALEPADAAVIIALRDQVRADVVVRIAERRINANRCEAFVDGVLIASLKAVDLAEKGMRLCGRIDCERALV